MANDLFAPPSKAELAMVQSTPSNNDLFAPPTKDELTGKSSQPGKGMIGSTIENLAKNPYGPTAPLFKGLDYLYNGPGAAQVAKVLDYPGGLIRTGLASVGGQLSGQPSAINDKDVVDAVKGNAPTSAQYLERLGVPEGYSAKIPFTNRRVSARDVGGFIGDIATNPLSYAGKYLEKVPGIGDVANVGGEAVESAGKSAYKSGFKKIDERLLENGGKPFSDVLLENGAPTGTTAQVAKEADAIGKGLLEKRGALYGEATDAGASIDMGHPFQRAETLISEMRKDPGLRDQAESLSELLNKYKSEGRVGMQSLSDWKTNLYNSLPKTAFNPDGSISNPGRAFQRALSLDFKDAIEGAGNMARPGLGEEVSSVNQDLGAILGAKKPMDLQIRRGNTTNAFGPIDAVLTALHPTAEIAKKGADIAKTTYARTNAGKALMDLGQSGLVDPALRQGLIEIMADKKKNGLLDEENRPRIRLSN